MSSTKLKYTQLKYKRTVIRDPSDISACAYILYYTILYILFFFNINIKSGCKINWNNVNAIET